MCGKKTKTSLYYEFIQNDIEKEIKLRKKQNEFFNEKELKDILLSITKLDLNINWNHIIHMQTINLKNGINKVGITDLIIAQNSIDNDIKLYSLDKHFKLMSKLHGILLFN